MTTHELVRKVTTTVRETLMHIGLMEAPPRLEMHRHPAGIVRARLMRRATLPYRRRVRYTSLQRLLS